MPLRAPRIGAAFAVAVGALAACVGQASADRVYHSQHIPLAAVEGGSLKSGFVENVHPNGPQVFAHEVYVLNGASPDTAYQVTLLVYADDPSCSTEPVAGGIDTAVLTTNGNGNGRADAFLAPEDIPAFLRDGTHGVAWELTANGSVAYRTGCSSVTLD